MKRNLTHVTVEALKPQPGGQFDVWDAKRPGFGVRISPAGTKTWILMYRLDGRTQRYVLGRFPHMSVADARDAADGYRGDVARGDNPARERAQAKGDPTFKEFGDTYLERHAAVHKRERSADDDRKMLNSADLDPWKDRKLADIERRDVIAVLDAVVARKAPVQANRLRALLSKLFNFAIARDLVEINPVSRVPREPERARERKLSDDEIRRLWLALETMARACTTGARSSQQRDRKHLADQKIATAFKIALLTGARRSEVLGMRWDEIDADNWWNLPATRTKNGQPLRIPLGATAVALLKELSHGSEFVFPGGRPGMALANIKKPLDQIRRDAALEDFHFHDLRRTAATRLAELAVERTTLKKLLNHSERGDITAVYDRHSYDGEKRAALGKWDRHLQRLLEGKKSNVVQLHG